MTGILGRKIGMTRIIQENGNSTVLTVVECTPNQVVQVKTKEKDGYSAVVIGFMPRKKPTKNKKFYHLKEFRVKNEEEFKIGDEITLQELKDITKVQITSISKGKGTQGVVKRHNFRTGPNSHGSKHHRNPGSIGAGTAPGKVMRGKKLAGRMGLNRITVKNVPIVYLDTEKNLIGVQGPIAGAKNNLVSIVY